MLLGMGIKGERCGRGLGGCRRGRLYEVVGGPLACGVRVEELIMAVYSLLIEFWGLEV